MDASHRDLVGSQRTRRPLEFANERLIGSGGRGVEHHWDHWHRSSPYTLAVTTHREILLTMATTFAITIDTAREVLKKGGRELTLKQLAFHCLNRLEEIS